MRQTTENTFNKGLVMDLNPLTTPNSVLTDNLNGTIITYNGDEFVLQNDMGNCKVDQGRLTPGFIPMGMKEYGGVIYIVSYNPITGAAEYGSFPSPQRDFSTTDYGNIGPVELTNTQFILENNITTEKVTKIVGKLFEPELFTLHPGDMYVITYNIHGAGKDIHDEATYEQYISKDPNNRRVFALRFYKITDDNNLTNLDAAKIKVIPDQDDLSGEYTYFTENSNSTLAVGLEFETLDTFDANVVDTSLKTNSNKRVTIEALGISNSSCTFLGVKVDVTLPSAQTFYIEKTASNKKVAATISDLLAGDTFQCKVTPYCQYVLYPKLAKDFVLTLGQYIDGSAGVNNLFRYYTDLSNNTVKIDFDYLFQGDSDQGVHLYVELYDPWSDFSVLRTVDNPTYYGINTVTIELNNDSTIDQFDSTTVGGTSPDKLIVNPDTIYEKTLLNSTNMIRSDQTLKKNHFYIVRVSGVDRTYDSSTETFSYVHYDFYKGLYTKTCTIFNKIYNSQAGLSTSDPSYVSDFDTLDFDISQIGYTSGIVPSSTRDLPIIVTTQRDDLTTSGNYYKVSATPIATTPGYKYTKTYENQKSYNINMTLTGTNQVFGTFKDNLLSISLPSIQDSDGTASGVIKPSITDDGYDGNGNVAPNSTARWQLATVTDKLLYTLSTDVTTSRSVYATVTANTKSASNYSEVSLLPSLYYRPNADSIFAGSTPGFSNPNATVLVRKYDVGVMRENGTQYSLNSTDGIQDVDLLSAINSAGLARTYSAMVMVSDEKTWTYGGSSGSYNSCNDVTPVASWKRCNMLLKGVDSGYYRLTKTIDIDAIVQFFNSLYVASNVTATLNVYYPNSGSIVANGNIVTTATYPDLTFTTNFTPNSVGGNYVRTYLSTFRLRATNTLGDFKASTINNYIASRLSDSIILDGKQTVRDGFIPYIDTVQQSTDIISVPAVVITQAGDNSIVNKYTSGQTQYLSDPIFNPGRYLHGTLFTDKPEYYGSLVPGSFTVNNVSTGAVVNPNTVYITANAGTPTWAGVFTKAGSCSGSTASPALFPSIAISKQ